MEHLSLADMIDFDTARRVKKRVVTSDRMVSDLLCYEPGQGTPEHHHVAEDEVFYVIDGAGSVTVDGERIPVAAQSVVFAPAGARHGLAADADSRMVVIYVRSPGRPVRKTAP